MRIAPLTLVYSATVPTVVPAHMRPIPYTEQITNDRDENARWKLLLVADYMPVRKLLNVFLSSHGYDVVLASSGTEAKAVTSRWVPDLVLMDFVLSDASGSELLAALRSQYGVALPAIFLASAQWSNGTIGCIAYNASTYFVQPGDLADIHELIHRLLQATRGLGDGSVT